MKILVYPHSMSIGGSQLNAVELATAVRDLDHEVVVFGTPGPLVDMVRSAGLEFVASPVPRRRPSSTVVRALGELIDEGSFDVLHAYEWPPALECCLAGSLSPQVPTVCTVMSMGVAPFIPSSVPLIVGTEHIRRSVAPLRRGAVTLLEPPVDTVVNAPGVDTADFARAHGLSPDDLHVVVVSRLATELKLEGLLSAIEVAPQLARDLPVRLVIVGGGPASNVVAQAADRANAAIGRDVVVLTGELLDPRPAYQLADVALGMGGSALRAMSFARPLVVQGERGFWVELNAGSVDRFLYQGWYGTGDGASGSATLAAVLRRLLTDEDRRRDLGELGRQLVQQRFSLERAARLQEHVYESAVSEDIAFRRVLWDGVRAGAGLCRHDARRRWNRARGKDVSEDFNSLGAQPPQRTSALSAAAAAQSPGRVRVARGRGPR